MRRFCYLILAVSIVAAVGCKPQHPSLVKMEEDFDPAIVGTVLVLPVISSITQGEDPNRESERITNRLLMEMLSQRADYKFIAPEQFRVAVDREGLGSGLEEFERIWITEHRIDEDFLSAMKSMNTDVVMVPQIYLWNKDEADYREESSASVTQVGMTISFVDPASGRIMWEATDENYKESVRTEGERVQASSYGIDRRVAGRTESGKDVFAAPPFEDVAVMVIQVLVDALPLKAVGDEE